MADKKSIILSVLILIILLAILPVLSSVFSQFIEVYRFNISLVPQNFLINAALNLSTYFNFFTRANPVNILGWAIIGIFLSYMLFSIAGTGLQKRYIQKDDYGSHGTARFQTFREIKKYYFRDRLGWFLGSNSAGLKYCIGMAGAYHPIGGNLKMQDSRPSGS